LLRRKANFQRSEDIQLSARTTGRKKKPFALPPKRGFTQEAAKPMTSFKKRDEIERRPMPVMKK